MPVPDDEIGEVYTHVQAAPRRRFKPRSDFAGEKSSPRVGVTGNNDCSTRIPFKRFAGSDLAPTHESRLGIEEESVVSGSGFSPDAGDELRGTASFHGSICEVAVIDNRSWKDTKCRVEGKMRVEIEGRAGTNAELRSVAANRLKASPSAQVDRLSANFEPPNSSNVRLRCDRRDTVLS